MILVLKLDCGVWPGKQPHEMENGSSGALTCGSLTNTSTLGLRGYSQS